MNARRETDSLNRKQTSVRNSVFAVLYAFVAVSAAIIAVNGFLAGAGRGQVGGGMYGWGYFKAFTTDSNILAGGVSAVMAVCAICSAIRGEEKTPAWLTRLHYVSTGALTLTFVTTALFLAPMQAAAGYGYVHLFSGSMFFFHFLNPVLSIVLFTTEGRGVRFGRREKLLALLPTLVYSVVYLVMVVFLKRWQDFYGFTFGGRMYMAPVSMTGMYLASWLLNALLARMHNGKGKREE